MDLFGIYNEYIIAVILALPRIMITFLMLPFLSRLVLPAMVKNAILLSLILFITPLVSSQINDLEMGSLTLITLILKESVIGLFIGFFSSLIFWAFASAGYFIDLHRGAMSATLFSAMLGSQTSNLGAFFAHLIATFFFISGGFLLLIQAIFTTYELWPVHSYYPTLDISNHAIVLTKMDYFMEITLIIAAPIVAVMALTEIGMALIGRFVPSINIFLLAMPIKSALAFLLLSLYFGYLLKYFNGSFKDLLLLPDFLSSAFK